jgi:hypothetical protein
MTESLLKTISTPADFQREIRIINRYLGLDDSEGKNEALSVKYHNLTLEEREFFLRSVQSFKVLSEMPAEEGPHSISKNTTRDLKFLFERWHLRAPDDFFSKITDEDCVELYRGAQQMYSNQKFHQLCSYDTLFVLLYGFDQLFERDIFTTNRIMARIQEVCRGPFETSRWNVPNHILKERDHVASQGKSFLIEPGYIAPVKALRGDIEEPLWLSTLKATPTSN